MFETFVDLFALGIVPMPVGQQKTASWAVGVGGAGDSAADSQPPGLGHPVPFFGPLHAVDLQLAGHHVHDARLKQALGGEAVQVQGRDGAETALQAHHSQIAGVLMHLAGKRVPAAAHVERQDRGLDGAGDVDGRHVYC